MNPSTTLPFDASMTVGACVANAPQTARILEELQIDFCCGGHRTLAEACAEKGIKEDALITRLVEATKEIADDSQTGWRRASATELCDHIEQTHHAFLRRELPRLSDLVDKVAQAHGDRHPEAVEVRTVFGELRAELEPHMLKEEGILFPAIRQLEQSETLPSLPFETVDNPIRMMEHEHDAAGDALKRIRQLTHDFQAPSDACPTWHVMLDGLRHLETDLHQHIHKENNLLFPNAQRLEAACQSN
ncbi:MAG: iron-sulfur cluster repair di-iron protein [Planctomycetaceae bacterium]|nr:iron-sulfur cluster repair di-iron protein [Planctomycetaceae bacterium]